MSYFNLGTYWHGRSLTLQQYADEAHGFFSELVRLHPAFQTLSWVGDRPNSAVSISAELSNLADLIYDYAGSKRHLYEHANADGTPSWQSTCIFGYSMRFCTGKPASAGGLSVSIRAGSTECPIPNAVTISFPDVEDPTFSHREFYNYKFLRGLFLSVIGFWKPERGLVTQHAFSEAVSGDELPYVGWFTYLRDPRTAALRNSVSLAGLEFDDEPDGGTLISLGRTIISPGNHAQVEKARRLRNLLIAEKLV